MSIFWKLKSNTGYVLSEHRKYTKIQKHSRKHKIQKGIQSDETSISESGETLRLGANGQWPLLTSLCETKYRKNTDEIQKYRRKYKIKKFFSL